MENEKLVIVKQDVANAVLGYMSQRPYAEVSELVRLFVDDINANNQKYTLSVKEMEMPPEIQAMVKQAESERKLKKVEDAQPETVEANA